MDMARKLKALAIAAAIFAMSVVGASTAQAASEFHIHKAPAIVTAEQTLPTLVISLTNGVTFKCNIAKFNGTTASTTFTTLTLTAEYGNANLRVSQLTSNDRYLVNSPRPRASSSRVCQ
jgi:hypothetical protein